jgi:hypothetical protein
MADADRRQGWAVFLFLGCVLVSITWVASRAHLFRPRPARSRDPAEAALEGALHGLSGSSPLGDRSPQDAVGSVLRGARGGGPGAGAFGAPGGGEGAAGAAGVQGGAGCAKGEDCSGGEGAAAGAAGEHGPTLKHVRFEGQAASLERSGAGLGGRSPSGSSAGEAADLGAAAGGGAASPDKIAGVFRDFIKKLNAQAAPAAVKRADRGGDYGVHRGGAEDGGGQPSVFRAAEDSPLMASPSYRNLVNAGGDAAHGVRLYQKGMADGAKDKAGKEFDGTFKTYAPIPIEKTKGAFGQSSIKAKSAQPEYSSPQ